MTTQEIREIAIESANTYYKFLEENDKGLQEVDVFELEYVNSKNLIKLRLASKLIDIEGVQFKNLRVNKKFDNSAVKIIEYDYEKSVMLIKPGEKATPFFEHLKHFDLKVIVDLKFLVLRVKRWFEMNGAKLKLPEKPSILIDSFREIQYFDEVHLQPSENQKKAIETLFTQPFSYIWGAPGTGKTQFVLAYAILHYIQNGAKVAIMAPTNNAVEQVLKGVLSMTDRAGVNRKQIIRIGTPSKDFAEKYPEVCEDRGISKQISDIDAQIDLYESILNYSEVKEWLSTGKQLLPLFDELLELAKLPRKDKEERKRIQELAKPMIIQIQRSFADFPEWDYFVGSITLSSCQSVYKQMLAFLDKHEVEQKSQETMFLEYKQNGMETIEADLEELLRQKQYLESMTTEKRLTEVNVVAYTLDGYIGSYADAQLIVDHFFVDEAGYANLIKTLSIMLRDTTVTLFGDHKQLPPVCELSEIDMDRDEKYQNMFLWAQSSIFLDTLFEYPKTYCIEQFLKNGNLNPTKMVQSSLNATYRFGENLAKVLARHVYTSDFHSLNPVGETRIIFVNARKMEPMKSRCSVNEVFEIKKVVQKLRQNWNTDFVILTPYKNQVKMLNKHLPQERNEFRILTVHGSQGREWDTVILSAVDTHDKWFVDSRKSMSKGLNLINTAVSRARKNLIIVCDIDYWAHQNGQLITELYKIKS